MAKPPISAHSPKTSSLLGRFSQLKIVKQASFGLYLDGGSHGEILLPNRYIPKNNTSNIGDWLEVFVYLDSEDRIVATTHTPYAQVGQFADLEVIAVNKVGVFFDWGLPKDLLMPFSEEVDSLRVGDRCIVYLHLDKRFGRITATARIEQHLDQTRPTYKVGESVALLVAGQTPMGFKVIINEAHWGLVHKNELFKPLEIGQKEQGFIKEMRSDGKISISLQPVAAQARRSLEEEIMAQLEAHHGMLPLSDKSAPHEITRHFNVSKSNFKKAIGGLYKQGRISIEKDCIRKL